MKRASKRELRLMEFVQKDFAARCLANQPATSRKIYETVARRLTLALGHTATVNDLTAKNFVIFNDAIASTAKSKRSQENYSCAFRRVWRVANKMGLVTEKPTHKKFFDESWRTVEMPALGEKPENLRQLFVQYRALRLRGRSAKNELQYWINIGHLQKFLGRDPRLTDLDDELISSFLHWILETGRKPATANKARNHILALWRFAARKRYVEMFPDVPRLTEPARVPKAWSEPELARLFAALEKEPGEIAGIPANCWWVALHQVLWWTAERIGAVLQIKWSDCDLDTGWLIVPAEARKFQTADKATQLPRVAINAIRAISKPDRDLLFPWPHEIPKLYYCYGKILQSAGLPHDRKSKFHRMRRSAASYFEAAGGNATELLGHTSRRVTLAYLSPTIVKPQQTAAMLFAPGGSSVEGGAA